MKLRRMKLIEICFIVLFAIILFAAILSATVLNLPDVSLALILVDFPIAGIITVYASLSIREEEEEKTQVSE